MKLRVRDRGKGRGVVSSSSRRVELALPAGVVVSFGVSSEQTFDLLADTDESEVSQSGIAPFVRFTSLVAGAVTNGDDTLTA